MPGGEGGKEGERGREREKRDVSVSPICDAREQPRLSESHAPCIIIAVLSVLFSVCFFCVFFCSVFVCTKNFDDFNQLIYRALPREERVT